MNIVKQDLHNLCHLYQKTKKCIHKCQGGYRVRNFTCCEHFNVISFVQFTDRESLCGIESSLIAFYSKLYHSGIKTAVARNALTKVNKNRDWRIYADFVQIHIKKMCLLYFKGNDFRLDIDKMIYAFDSSSIHLCLSLFPWGKFHHHQKGTFKTHTHTLLDLRRSIPAFIHLTDNSIHDVNILNSALVKLAVSYLTNKGVDFYGSFNFIHVKRTIFVTRAKDNMVYQVEDNSEVDKDAGLIRDQVNS